MDNLDWNQLKAFLETAETGSLSAAARKLGLTQPTLSRQVAAIEQRMGVTLFERVGKSMALTPTGLDLLEHARAMGVAAEALVLAATGRSQAVGGVVSVSATDVVAAILLPPLVRQLRDQEPGIAIEVISSNALSDLLRREADIAIRHVKPEQPELIARIAVALDVGTVCPAHVVVIALPVQAVRRGQPVFADVVFPRAKAENGTVEIKDGKLLLKDVTQVLACDNWGLIGLVVRRIVVCVELVFWGVVKEFF
mgnify:CR=1 FL=1